MKPWLHAQISAKRFGGVPGDYIAIHNWFDQTKAHVPNARHRNILHNAFGIFLAEQQFGTMVQDAAGRWERMPWIRISGSDKVVQVRDVAEQHVLDDLGRIPTLEECLKGVEVAEATVGNIRRGSIRLAPETTLTIVD